MQTKQAKILGIKYTLIFSTIHVLVFFVMFIFIDNSPGTKKFRSTIISYFDIIIPMMLLCSWYFGRELGQKLFINRKPRYNACYYAIFMTTSLSHLIIAFNIMMDDFRVVNANSIIGSIVLGGICVTALNMFPTMLTAMVMRWAVRSKQRKLRQIRS